MNRTSINTTSSLSTNTKTINLETDIKTPILKKLNSIKKNNYKTPKIFIPVQNNYINFKDSFKNLTFKNDIDKSEKSSSIESSESKSCKSNNTSSSAQSQLKSISLIKKHKKISNLPYNLINNEPLKLQYINQHMKNYSKLPKYSSDCIGVKLKKDIIFPKVEIFSKKSRKNFLLSTRKKFAQRKIFLNNDNKYVSFGLYYDKDIIEKSEELSKELIENDSDMDCESDNENIITGINICLYDIQKAISEIKENSNSISYVKKKKLNFIS